MAVSHIFYALPPVLGSNASEYQVLETTGGEGVVLVLRSCFPLGASGWPLNYRWVFVLKSRGA